MILVPAERERERERDYASYDWLKKMNEREREQLKKNIWSD